MRELSQALDPELGGAIVAHCDRVAVLEAKPGHDGDSVVFGQARTHLGEHTRAVAWRTGTPEDGGPDGARIVDVEIQLIGSQGVESHGRAQRLDTPDCWPARLLDGLGKQRGQHILLGEALGADRDRALRTARGVNQAGHDEDVERDEPRERTTPEAAPAHREPALERAHQSVEPQREHGRGHAAEHDGAAEDEVAPAGCAHRRRQRRRADDPHGRGPNTGDDHR